MNAELLPLGSTMENILQLIAEIYLEIVFPQIYFAPSVISWVTI